MSIEVQAKMHGILTYVILYVEDISFYYMSTNGKCTVIMRTSGTQLQLEDSYSDVKKKVWEAIHE